MRRSPFAVAAGLALVVATLVQPPPAFAASVPAGMVDPDNVHVQNFEGWGTALAWGANVVGGWSDTKRTDIADKLFSSTSGLGLNVVRYHIGAGQPSNWEAIGCGEQRPGSPLPTFSTSSGVYDWTADANQRWFAQAAKERGADKWLAYASSAPYWMTINGCTNGGDDDGALTTGSWGHDGDGTGAYNGTTSYSVTGNNSVNVKFEGTQIAFRASKSSDSGKAAISVDGGLETIVDLYSATRQGDQLVYTSPVLTSGTHTLKVRVTGARNSASSGNYVSPDRVVISPGAVSVDDQVSGTGVNEFNYRKENGGQNLKGYWGYDGDGTGAYAGTSSWSNRAEDSVTVKFDGTQVAFHAVKTPDSGKAGFSVDGGAESVVDLYSATRQANQLVYTSDVLTSGVHTLKVRVTGTKNASSSGVFVSPDRVVLSPGAPDEVSVDDQVRGTGVNQFDYHWGMYEPFADYLTEVTEHFADSEGITFDLLDPLNEPENPWFRTGNQEGAAFDQPSQDELINRVGQSLAAKSITATTIAAPDSWVPGAKSHFDNYSTSAKGYISTINTHTYFTSNDGQVALRGTAKDWGKELWMSEFGTSEVPLGQAGLYSDPTQVQPAIQLASQIVTDMTYMRPTAWLLWDGLESREVNDTEGSSWGLIWAKYNDPAETYTVAKQYYGYGNFTKFIRPGYQLIESGDDQTLAAYDPAGQKLVLVAYNDGSSARSLSYDLSKFSGMTTAKRYRTSGSEDLATLTDLSVSDNQLAVTLDSKSITTFVLSGASSRRDLTTINDRNTGTGRNQFEYSGSWSNGSQTDAYLGDNSWSGSTDDYYKVRFNGTKAFVYGARGPDLGIAAVSIDGGAETLVDLYAATRTDNVRVYTSSTVLHGDHTIKVRVTGTKNATSTGVYVPADRVDVVQPVTTRLDDASVGTGTNQFEYSGTGWASGAQPGAFGNASHWSGQTGDYYQVDFTGTKVDLYGSRAPSNGIAAVSIDGGAETNLDLYAASRLDNVLVWSSPLLTAGDHTIKVRVTGSKNAASSGTYLGADRVDVPAASTQLVARHSSKCLSVSDWSTADGAASVQWACGGGSANQLWTAQPVGGGYYRLVAKHTGKCLNVSGASTADGASVVQYTCQGPKNEQWSLQDAGDGYKRLVARHSGKCLTVTGASTADGAYLIQSTCGTGTNQQWSGLGT